MAGFESPAADGQSKKRRNLPYGVSRVAMNVAGDYIGCAHGAWGAARSHREFEFFTRRAAAISAGFLFLFERF